MRMELNFVRKLFYRKCTYCGEKRETREISREIGRICFTCYREKFMSRQAKRCFDRQVEKRGVQ